MGFEMDFINIPAIVIICYLVAEVVKVTRLDNKYIPIVCGISGLILGIVAMYIMPDFPSSDYLTSAAIGIVSGLSATGINQIAKIKAKKEE